MTVTLENPAAPAVAAIPAPRTEHTPNTWVRELSSGEAALALALSDMPATEEERDRAVGEYLPAVFPNPRRLTTAGQARVAAWIVQGTERAGGQAALWEADNQWRRMNLGTWTASARRAFTARFGGQRRINQAVGMASYAPLTAQDRVRVSMAVSEATDALISRLSGLYAIASQTGPNVAFLMTPRDARMAATSEGLALIPGYQGGLRLK